MKQLIAVFLLLIGLCNISTAQDSTTLFHYETMPEYPGGEEQFKKDIENYWQARMKELFPQAHPDNLKSDEIKHKLIVQFVVDEEGAAKEPSILIGLHPKLNEEAIRYVNQLPRFKPGTFKEEPHRFKFVFPIFVHPYYLRLLESEEMVYDVDAVDKMPEYPGGPRQLIYDWQRQLATFKDFGIEHGVPPRVIVSCIINEEGEVTDADVIRSVDPKYDKEALQFVNSMPRWTPGEHKGKKVKARVTLPFNTRLQ